MCISIPNSTLLAKPRAKPPIYGKNQNKTKLRACLVVVFKNCFLFLKTTNTKNLFDRRNCFCFSYSPCSQNDTFERTKKKYVIFPIFLLFREQKKRYKRIVVLRVFLISVLTFPFLQYNDGFSNNTKQR